MTRSQRFSALVVMLICHCQVQAQSHVQSQTNSNCGNSPAAQQLAQLIQNHPKQQRMVLNCSKKLSTIAAIKAGHINDNEDIWHHAGRMAPNQLLRHHGFKLPPTYPFFGNQVEALAGGEEVVEQVLTEFLNSKPHRMLLLGEDAFFRAQDQIGVAYLEDPESDHRHYWVVIIATEKNNTIKQDPVIEVKPPVISPKKRKPESIRERHYRKRVKRQWN